MPTQAKVSVHDPRVQERLRTSFANLAHGETKNVSEDLAREFGVSVNTIANWRRRLGLLRSGAGTATSSVSAVNLRSMDEDALVKLIENARRELANRSDKLEARKAREIARLEAKYQRQHEKVQHALRSI